MDEPYHEESIIKFREIYSKYGESVDLMEKIGNKFEKAQAMLIKEVASSDLEYSKYYYEKKRAEMSPVLREWAKETYEKHPDIVEHMRKSLDPLDRAIAIRIKVLAGVEEEKGSDA
jgi:hypothetical protein